MYAPCYYLWNPNLYMSAISQPFYPASLPFSALSPLSSTETEISLINQENQVNLSEENSESAK